MYWLAFLNVLDQTQYSLKYTPNSQLDNSVDNTYVELIPVVQLQLLP